MDGCADKWAASDLTAALAQHDVTAQDRLTVELGLIILLLIIRFLSTCRSLTHTHTLALRSRLSLHVVLTSFHLVSLYRELEGAAVSSGDQVEGMCDGGGGEGEKSHDLCSPAGGGL